MNLGYNRDIPNAPNNPSADQPRMKINTNSIDTLIGVDHYSFKNNAGGFHKKVSLLNSSAPALGSANGILFSTLYNTQAWPAWVNALGTTILCGGPTTAAATGRVYLPGGILVMWGSATTGNSSPNIGKVIVNFPAPIFSQVYAGLATGQFLASSASITVTTSQAEIYTYDVTDGTRYPSVPVYYIVIGLAA